MINFEQTKKKLLRTPTPEGGQGSHTCKAGPQWVAKPHPLWGIRTAITGLRSISNGIGCQREGHWTVEFPLNMGGQFVSKSLRKMSPFGRKDIFQNNQEINFPLSTGARALKPLAALDSGNASPLTPKGGPSADPARRNRPEEPAVPPSGSYGPAGSYGGGKGPEGSAQKKLFSDTQGKAKNLIRRYIILGERRTSNYLWSFMILLGSCGFLLTGLSSYNGFNILPFLQVKDLSFFPQGLLMSFYGSLGFLLSFYWWFNIFWNVGGGFNEFNKKEGKIRIFRWGYPGKNRRIDLSYSLKDVEAIKVELKQGLDPQRTIYLKLKGSSLASATPLRGVGREIPLTGIGEPLTLKEIEKQASELANFLQVSLEGL